MSNRKKVFSLASKLNADIEISKGCGTMISVWLPDGKVWTENGSQVLTDSAFEGTGIGEAWADLLDRMECGVDDEE